MADDWNEKALRRNSYETDQGELSASGTINAGQVDERAGFLRSVKFTTRLLPSMRCGPESCTQGTSGLTLTFWPILFPVDSHFVNP